MNCWKCTAVKVKIDGLLNEKIRKIMDIIRDINGDIEINNCSDGQV